MALKHRHHLRKSEIREISEKLATEFGGEVRGVLGENIEIADLNEEAEIILVNGEPIFFKLKDRFIPTLSTASSLRLKRVTVDMGAVSHITNGADVMSPGIVRVDDDITQGDVIGVEDEENHKLLAIGEALESGSALKGERGKVVKNLHYVGDKLWKLSKEI